MKKIIILMIISLLLMPVFVFAQADQQFFKAKITEIINEQELIREDGTKTIQQNLKAVGLAGEWEKKEILINGISEIDVYSSQTYNKGDRVFVGATMDENNYTVFQIIDYDRGNSIWWLVFIFLAIIFFVAGKKGIGSVLALIFTFFIIFKFIVPQIISGYNPLFISLVGSIIILLVIIYLTEGFNRKSNVAIISIFLSLALVGIISLLFTYLTRLSGIDEEAMFLGGLTAEAINFQGLLLAGIIIGALGVLDDVVISQISTVEQIKSANSSLNNQEVYKKSMAVGISHIASMVNTLFLAYAGAALTLLILFSVNVQDLSFSLLINNELVTTEIVRALCGSVGLIISVPLATKIAVKYL